MGTIPYSGVWHATIEDPLLEIGSVSSEIGDLVPLADWSTHKCTCSDAGKLQSFAGPNTRTVAQWGQPEVSASCSSSFLWTSSTLDSGVCRHYVHPSLSFGIKHMSQMRENTEWRTCWRASRDDRCYRGRGRQLHGKLCTRRGSWCWKSVGHVSCPLPSV